LRIYVDTNMAIRAMEHTDEAANAVSRIFHAATRSELSLVTSEITLGEVLVAPFKSSDTHLEAAYRALLTDREIIELVPITRDILIMAARVRGRMTMKLPDAIHAATATMERCDVMLTFDRRFAGSGSFAIVEPNDRRFASLSTDD
jgi:predicted nucleic acid-binding protein